MQPEPGYPFSLRVSVDYRLSAGGLVATLHATNTGTAAAPFGAGLHPYLSPGAAAVDDLVLEVPARTRVPLDERRLPTGPPVPVEGTDLDFRRARRIDAQRLDTCFGDLDRNPAGVARVRLESAGASGGSRSGWTRASASCRCTRPTTSPTRNAAAAGWPSSR